MTVFDVKMEDLFESCIVTEQDIRNYREFEDLHSLLTAYLMLKAMMECDPGDTELWEQAEALKRRIDAIPDDYDEDDC